MAINQGYAKSKFGTLKIAEFVSKNLFCPSDAVNKAKNQILAKYYAHCNGNHVNSTSCYPYVFVLIAYGHSVPRFLYWCECDL